MNVSSSPSPVMYACDRMPHTLTIARRFLLRGLVLLFLDGPSAAVTAQELRGSVVG